MAAESQGSQEGRISDITGSNRQPVDYSHRHFVNLAATVFLLSLAIVSIWTINAFDRQEKLQRCINSGRKDCIPVAAPPRGMVELVR